MSLVVTYVPYGQLSYVLPNIIHNLAKSEFWTKGRASTDDIVKFLYTQHMQLWIAHNPDEQKIWGYAITELKQYPKCKMLVVQYIAGDYGSLKLFGDLMFEKLEEFAKLENCKGIECFARSGWRNFTKKLGFNSQTVVYEKYFDEVQQ